MKTTFCVWSAVVRRVLSKVFRSALCAALAVWFVAGSGALALEIGGRTYAGADQGLGAGYSFAVVNGTNTHTFAGAGHTWSGAVTINSGARVRVVDGGTITRTAGDYDYTAGGVLEFNNTTFAHYGNNGMRGRQEFLNGAKLLLRNRAGVNTYYLTDGAELVVDSTSSIEFDNDTGVGTYFGFRLGAGLTLLNGTITVVDSDVTIEAGSAVRDANGTINVAAGYTLTINTTANQQRWGATATGLTIQGEGNLSIVTPTVDGTAGGFLSIATTGSNTWSGGGNLNNNGEVRIASGVTVYKTGGDTGANINGNGLISVDGTFRLSGSTAQLRLRGGGVSMRVNNGGKLLLTDGGGSNQLIIGGGTPSATALILMSGSTLEVTLGSASHVVNAFGAVYGVIDVKSGATMVVNNGALQIDQYSDGATYGMKFDGVHLTAGMTSLDAGIYKISRTLDLNSNVGPNKFSTIGANATVRFVGTNAVFDAVGTFTTVNGRLGLEAGRTNRVTTAAAVTVAGTGKLLVGLNAPDTVDPALTTNACLKVGTSVTLSDGAGIEVVDSGGVTQGEYVIVSAPTVSAPGTHSVTFPEGMPTGVHRAKVQVRGGNKLILMLRGAGGTVFIFK